jgi:hypothetical protein
MLIGFIGFYRNWTPLYETRLSPWRRILKQAPAPGTCSKEDGAKLMTKLWNADDRTADEKFAEYGESNDKLLESLKREVLAGPTLKRPNPNRRFYVKQTGAHGHKVQCCYKQMCRKKPRRQCGERFTEDNANSTKQSEVCA